MLNSLPRAALLCALASFTAGCLPTDQSAEVEALRTYVLRLEDELTVLKGSREQRETLLDQQLAEAFRRVEELEEVQGTSRSALLQQFSAQTEAMQQMNRGFNLMREMVETGQTWAPFGIGFEGHTVARTRHGSFLVSLRGHEQTGSGIRLDLNLGNPTGLRVHQFTLLGEFGPPPPQNLDELDYEERLRVNDAWEGSLHSFSETVVADLPPHDWSELSLTLPAQRFADLEFIRFRMVIDRVSLLQATDPNTVVFSVDRSEGILLPSDYGTFILAVKEHRPVPGGHEITVEIGNPYGMTIVKARLEGRHGPKAPGQSQFTDFAEYSAALVAWDQRLQPFETEISQNLAPFQWNRVTFKVRGATEDDLEFIRAALEIVHVSLRPAN